ncbi:MAG: restriction endonuclease subunit S, partial [Planctomycetota bacterium]|nr:restriction endonuclease subunit S [Planctomycetota bacterium]
DKTPLLVRKFGYDRSRRNLRLAHLLTTLTKSPINLNHCNVLEEVPQESPFNAIVTFPAFGRIRNPKSFREDLDLKTRLQEVGFVAAAIAALNAGGQCVMIVPVGVLHSASSRVLRELLLRDTDVKAVISLPQSDRVINNMSPLVMLVFHKSEIENSEFATKRVWFYSLDRKQLNDLKRFFHMKTQASPDILQRWKDYRDSGFQVAPGLESNATLPIESSMPRFWWADINTVKKANFELLGRRYRPKPTPPVLPPPNLIIDEMLKIEEQLKNALSGLRDELGSGQVKGAKVTLGELVTLARGFRPRRGKIELNGIEFPLARLSDVPEVSHSLPLINNTEQRVSKDVVEERRLTLVPASTVLVSTLGKSVKIALAGCDLAVNQSWLALATKKPTDLFSTPSVRPEFLAYNLVAHRPEIERLGVGGQLRRIHWGQLKSLELIVPDLETQDQLLNQLKKLADFFKQQSELATLSKQLFKSHLDRILLPRMEEEG